MIRTLFQKPVLSASFFAVVAILLLLGFQQGSARVQSVAAVRPIAVGAQGGSGSGSFVMDGDWFYVLRGSRFYKVQKSTMTVFQTLDLN